MLKNQKKTAGKKLTTKKEKELKILEASELLQIVGGDGNHRL